MADWQQDLTTSIQHALRGTETWRGMDLATSRLHLAIFREPYLSLVFNGEKTIESRFSKRRRPPFDQVSRGDIVLLKAVSGPVCGVALVARTWFFQRRRTWNSLRQEFSRAMCADDDDFWTARAEANFATLVQLENVTRLSDLDCAKRDRRGWVILRDSSLW